MTSISKLYRMLGGDKYAGEKQNWVRKIVNVGGGTTLFDGGQGGTLEEGAFEQTWRRGSVPGRYLDVCKRMW